MGIDSGGDDAEWSGAVEDGLLASVGEAIVA